MKDIYPAFANKVDFYAIGQSETETLDQFEHDQIERDFILGQSPKYTVTF